MVVAAHARRRRVQPTVGRCTPSTCTLHQRHRRYVLISSLTLWTPFRAHTHRRSGCGRQKPFDRRIMSFLASSRFLPPQLRIRFILVSMNTSRHHHQSVSTGPSRSSGQFTSRTGPITSHPRRRGELLSQPPANGCSKSIPNLMASATCRPRLQGPCRRRLGLDCDR
jgi:hypothetical protein